MKGSCQRAIDATFKPLFTSILTILKLAVNSHEMKFFASSL
jgi:hypothetical protein